MKKGAGLTCPLVSATGDYFPVFTRRSRVLTQALKAKMIERLQLDLDEGVRDSMRPEAARLLRELEDIDTPHARRSAIGERLCAIGDPRPGVGLRPDGLPDIVWCYVEVPEHLRGKKIEFISSEGKLGDFEVRPFYIARYPITFLQFQAFLDDPEGFERDAWWEGLEEKYRKQAMEEQRFKFANHPRENVSWYQTVAFCRWLTAKLPADAWPQEAVNPRPLLPRSEGEALNPRPLLPQGEGEALNPRPLLPRGEGEAVNPRPLLPRGEGEALNPRPLLPRGEGEALNPRPLLPQGEGESYREMARQVMVRLARELRQKQTDAESILWECLRDRRLGGLKFRRQHPVARTSYVVDFLCYESRLVVEVDGPVHDRQVEADLARQRELEALGYHVLRFTNAQVFSDLEHVLTTILQTHRAFSLLPEGEGPGMRAARQLRLPAEWEWQYAATGGNPAHGYPWGPDWDGRRANTTESGLGRTTAVGMYPQGAASSGALDMSGNVWEWCLNEHEKPTNTGIAGDALRVLRGGSWDLNQDDARAASRFRYFPYLRSSFWGFRVVCASPI